MIGYVRPYKPDLTFAAYAVYRAIYCGLCKTLGQTYGQLARMALTYDLTAYALMWMSVWPESEFLVFQNEICPTHPFKKNSFVTQNAILEAAADLTLATLLHKLEDDKRDDNSKAAKTLLALLKKEKKKNILRVPGLYEAFVPGLQQLHEQERKLLAGETGLFFEMGESNAVVAKQALQALHSSARYQEVFAWDSVQGFSCAEQIEILFSLLAQWVYYLDAQVDFEEDLQKGRANPFGCQPIDFSLLKRKADMILLDLERKILEAGAKLPYRRWADLVGNLLGQGLPYMRKHVVEEGKKQLSLDFFRRERS